MDSDFIFFKGLDSYGDDISFHDKKTIEELKQICINSKEIVAFNTLGFMKKAITNPAMFGKCPQYNKRDGLYVHKDRMKKMDPIRIEGYDYVNGMDSLGNDVAYQLPTTMKQLAEYASAYGYEAFNTMGFMKSAISELTKSTIGGIYIKRNLFRVKMLCNWCSSKELCDDWNRMSQGNYRWNDIEITSSDKNIDFYVLVNRPNGADHYVPQRTIVLHMEPWCYDPKQHWGIKTWGPWAKPEKSKFLQVRSHDKYLNTTFWQLKTTYSEFKSMGDISKSKMISTICSSKYFDPGHIKRIDFLKFVENKKDPNVMIHIYNYDNHHKFVNYQGPHPSGNKDVAILPYKYYFMMENNAERNFITEKIWEPLIAECVCFYWGCPNVTDWINSETFILLDINNFEKSYQIIKEAIANDEWSKRISAIRIEKQKILDYYNFFPTLERTIKEEFKFKYSPSDDAIIYHKYFHSLINVDIRRVCFIHGFSEVMINQVIKTNLFDKIIVVNIGRDLSFNNEKVLLINYSNDFSLTAKETMKLINAFSKFCECQILYLHTERMDTKWKEKLMNTLVNGGAKSIELLRCYDIVGCNFQASPRRHFSFNFWWCNSNYFKNLDMGEDYEWVALSNSNAKYFSFSTIDDIYNGIKIKCINLARRPDRKESTSKQLIKEGLLSKTDFYEAIDGQKLVATDFIKNLFTGNDFGNIKSVIGCALSHYNLWNQLLEDSCDMYLILEDDIQIVDQFDTKMLLLMDELKKKSWDIVYLGYHERKPTIASSMEIIPYNVRNNIGGLFGYLLNKAAVIKFLAFIEENGIKHGIDYLMFHYYKEMDLKQFQVVPQMITSQYVSSVNFVDSDIQYDQNKLF